MTYDRTDPATSPSAAELRVARVVSLKRRLLRDLGHRPSTAEEMLAQAAAGSMVALEDMDAVLMAMGATSGRTKKPRPILRQRQAVASQLVNQLAQLGIRRQSKAPTLADHLAKRSRSKREGTDGTD